MYFRLALVAVIAFATCPPGATAVTWNVTATTIPPAGEVFFGFSPQGVGTGASPATLVFSGKHMLHEVSVQQAGSAFNFTTVAMNADPIPGALKAQGYDHIGDIDVAVAAGTGGTVFVIAPIEEPTYTRPILATYVRNGSTFAFDGSAVASQQRHCPWAAVAMLTRTGFRNDCVLSSEYDNVTQVFCYTWPGFAFEYTLRLQKVGDNGLLRVQGGYVNQSTFHLYLTTDQNANPGGHNLFEFDLTAVVHAEEPYAPLIASQKVVLADGLAEVEGLTVDNSGRMWIVTNFLSLAPPIFTLQQQ